MNANPLPCKSRLSMNSPFMQSGNQFNSYDEEWEVLHERNAMKRTRDSDKCRDPKPLPCVWNLPED